MLRTIQDEISAACCRLRLSEFPASIIGDYRMATPWTTSLCCRAGEKYSKVNHVLEEMQLKMQLGWERHFSLQTNHLPVPAAEKGPSLKGESGNLPGA